MGRGAWRLSVYGMIAVGLLAVYFSVDPAVSVWFPKCGFKMLTGYDCPGCGSQRMIHALLHGDVGAAFRYNAFLLCASPLLILVVVADAGRCRWPRLQRIFLSPAFLWTLLGSLMLWWVGRNIIGW